MRPDLHAATASVTALRARLARAPHAEAHLAEIHDALSTGYAQGLAADAWLADTDNRLHELIDDAPIAARARELRILSRDHSLCRTELTALREELAELHGEYDDLLSHSAPGDTLPGPRRITHRPATGTPSGD